MYDAFAMMRMLAMRQGHSTSSTRTQTQTRNTTLERPFISAPLIIINR